MAAEDRSATTSRGSGIARSYAELLLFLNGVFLVRFDGDINLGPFLQAHLISILIGQGINDPNLAVQIVSP